MDDEFRAAAREEFSRLLDRWKMVETSIKQAEQISSEAQIPAINELRYASRQLFNAIIHLDRAELSEEDKKKISKRIIVADQYLYNAEHDISDSIVTFYRHVTIDINERYGRNIVTSHFPLYPIFCEHIKDCERLISESRGNYEQRSDNYTKIRTNHVPHLLKLHDNLIEAQVSAEEEKNRTDNAIKLAEGRVTLALGITIFSVPLALLGIALAFYMWLVTPAQYCVHHGKTPILNIICSGQ